MKPVIAVIVLLVCMPAVLALDNYFSYRMNFYEQQNHTQTVTFTGKLSVTIPGGFSLSNYTGAATVNVSNITWNSNVSTSVNYTLLSVANCTEGDYYVSNIYENDVFVDEFVFVCVPDNKISDCKVEYGHGDANYLTDLYISNEPVVLFNLIRVWNIGDYLNPDEAAINATLECTFPDYLVSTYGRVEVDHYPNYVNGTFLWNRIDNGYWFRIGVLSQHLRNLTINNYYNVTCSHLTYQFEHQQVIAEHDGCYVEIRDDEPFVFTVVDDPSDSNKAVLTITNNEKYPIYDITYDRLLDNIYTTESYRELDAGESVVYTIDRSTICNITFFFIPSWQINSIHPIYYSQLMNCSQLNHAPVLDAIGNKTAYVNQTFYYDVNATDIDGDNITFGDNSSFFDINSSTGVINFTANSSVIGVHAINISVYDVYNASDWEVIYMTINITPAVSLPAPTLYINLNPDGNSSDLNWTNVTEADCYNIYFADNNLSFSSTPNISCINSLNFTDTNASLTDLRYYKVEAVKGVLTNASTKYGCKYSYHFISSTDTLKGKNLLTLVCNKSYTAEEFLDGVPNNAASYLTRLNRWNNPEAEFYESHPKDSTVNDYNMSLGLGYLIFVVSNATYNTVGYAIEDYVTLDLVSSTDTLKGKNYAGLPYSDHVFSADEFISEVPNNSGSYITKLDRVSNPEIEYWVSHPSGSSVNNYTMHDKGLGYLVFVVRNETYTPG